MGCGDRSREKLLALSYEPLARFGPSDVPPRARAFSRADPGSKMKAGLRRERDEAQGEAGHGKAQQRRAADCFCGGDLRVDSSAALDGVCCAARAASFLKRAAAPDSVSHPMLSLARCSRRRFHFAAIVIGEPDLRRGHVFLEVRDLRRARNGQEHRRAMQQPCQ